MSSLIDPLQAKAAQSTQDVQSGATPDTAASKAALKQTVAAVPYDSPEANTMTPRSMRYKISAAQAAQTPPTPVVTSDYSPAPPGSPFHDAARPILEAEPNLDQETRASLWDSFHAAPDAPALAKVLAPLAVPSDDLKHRLYVAKVGSTTAAGPVEKVIGAVHMLAALDPAMLDNAEKVGHWS